MLEHKKIFYNNLIENVEKHLGSDCYKYIDACDRAGVKHTQYLYAKRIIKQNEGASKKSVKVAKDDIVKKSITVKKSTMAKPKVVKKSTLAKPKVVKISTLAKPKVVKISTSVKPKIVKNSKTDKKGTKKIIKKLDNDKILKQQKKLYDNVLSLYKNKNYTVAEACKKINISVAKYYKICKLLKMETIGTMRKNKLKIKNQKGGNIINTVNENKSKSCDIIDNKVDNVADMDILKSADFENNKVVEFLKNISEAQEIDTFEFPTDESKKQIMLEQVLKFKNLSNKINSCK